MNKTVAKNRIQNGKMALGIELDSTKIKAGLEIERAAVENLNQWFDEIKTQNQGLIYILTKLLI